MGEAYVYTHLHILFLRQLEDPTINTQITREEERKLPHDYTVKPLDDIPFIYTHQLPLYTTLHELPDPTVNTK